MDEHGHIFDLVADVRRRVSRWGNTEGELLETDSEICYRGMPVSELRARGCKVLP